eukprot:3520197-Pleurochrysis_carterae.AAC.3
MISAFSRRRGITAPGRPQSCALTDCHSRGQPMLFSSQGTTRVGPASLNTRTTIVQCALAVDVLCCLSPFSSAVLPATTPRRSADLRANAEGRSSAASGESRRCAHNNSIRVI